MGKEPLTSPDHDRSGTTVDEAVATAEQGTQVEGVHTPSGDEVSGESRVEQMTEVEGGTEPRVDGDLAEPGMPAAPGPGPADIDAGGAQRLEGARISDRAAAGEAVPEGPPFDTDTAGDPQDSSGAGD